MFNTMKPLIDILAMKLHDQRAAAQAADAYVNWEKQGRSGTFNQWLRKTLTLQIDLSQKADKQTNFAGHTDPEAMRRAADYIDRWYNTKESELRVYYICHAKPDGTT